LGRTEALVCCQKTCHKAKRRVRVKYSPPYAGPRAPRGGVTRKRRCTYRHSQSSIDGQKPLSLSLSLSLSDTSSENASAEEPDASEEDSECRCTNDEHRAQASSRRLPPQWRPLLVVEATRTMREEAPQAFRRGEHMGRVGFDPRSFFRWHGRSPVCHPTCDVPFPPRRSGEHRKGMIPARPYATRTNGEWGYSTRRLCWATCAQGRCHPKEALYLPTFSHLLIVNKPLSLSPSLSLQPGRCSSRLGSGLSYNTSITALWFNF